MKTIDSRNYRAMAIAALIAIGIASTIATGGGGGGSTIAPQPPPSPPPTDSMVDITADNAFDVTVTVVEAVNLTLEIGDITGGGIGTGVASLPPPLAAPDKGLGGLAMKPLSSDAQEIEQCANGGTVDITATLANLLRLTVGDTIQAIFDNCDDGDGYILNGQIDIEVTRSEGDLLTEIFLLGLDVVLTDIAITEGAETSTINGDFALTLDSLGWPVVSQTIEGSELVASIASETITLSGFSHFYRVDGGMVPEAVFVTVEGRMESASLGGAVDYETPVPVEASGEENPYAGEVLITGDGGSTIRIVFNDSSSVTLEVDENGDGVIDEYIETTWEELQGITS